MNSAPGSARPRDHETARALTSPAGIPIRLAIECHRTPRLVVDDLCGGAPVVTQLGQFGAGHSDGVEVASGHDWATVHRPSSSSTNNVSRSTRVDNGKPGAIACSRLSAVASSSWLPTVRCGCGSGNAPPYGGQSGNACTKLRVICLKCSSGSGDKNRTAPGNLFTVAKVASNESSPAAIAATSCAVASSTVDRNGCRTVTCAGTPRAAIGSFTSR